MNIPFKILPSIGYKNSQFLLKTFVDNLTIDIYQGAKKIKSIATGNNRNLIISRFNVVGVILARCNFNNETFEQKIEIQDSYKLGTSELKNVYLFENCKYSFFLMKDRLLLFDEDENQVYEEYYCSPTEIHQIDENNFLVLTLVDKGNYELINLGIFSTKSLSVVSELLEKVKIKIMPEHRKVWLTNIEKNVIWCYNILNEKNECFDEILCLKDIKNYYLDPGKENIFVEFDDRFLIIRLNNPYHLLEIKKNSNIAIDILGYTFILENNTLECRNILNDYYQKTFITSNLDLYNSFCLERSFTIKDKRFIYVGDILKSKCIELSENVGNTDVINRIQNSEYYSSYEFPENEVKSKELIIDIYPTELGIYLIKMIKHFKNLQKNNGEKVLTKEDNNFELILCCNDNLMVLESNIKSIRILGYNNHLLLIEINGNKLLFSGKNKLAINKDQKVEIFSINGLNYFLIESNNYYSLFESRDLYKPILNNIDILNKDLFNNFKDHKVIWFYYKDNNDKTKIYVFDLKTSAKLNINEPELIYQSDQDVNKFRFYQSYAITKNNVIFNPTTLEVKDSIFGNIISYSEQLNKIVTMRDNNIYLFKFNFLNKKFEHIEIPFIIHKYKEAYLSPDGKFLVLKEEKSNRYFYYDIDKEKIITFISDNFLAFTQDGSLIIEDNKTRAIQIFDPKTFEYITPSNYQYYRFISPVGKFFAQISIKQRYIFKPENRVISIDEAKQYEQDLDNPLFFGNSNDKLKNEKMKKVEKNREDIFNKYKDFFEKNNIKDFNNITSQTVIKLEKYLEFGVVDSDIKAELVCPDDLVYLNYVAFSNDNKYLAYVGKPSSGGLIHLIEISYDGSNISLVKSFISRKPNWACWKCGFSKMGYFATYDSNGDTYLFFVDDKLFNKGTEIKKILGKSFRCFSPSGKYMALSEKRYEPISLGGRGHIESKKLYIIKLENLQIIDFYEDHGDYIQLVAFSEDEKRIMSLSQDGVVVIRNINLEDQQDKINNCLIYQIISS